MESLIQSIAKEKMNGIYHRIEFFKLSSINIEGLTGLVKVVKTDKILKFALKII